LKIASKFFGQRFACGASITGDDEIVIQGDFKDDLFDIIPGKWPEVNKGIRKLAKYHCSIAVDFHLDLMKLSKYDFILLNSIVLLSK